MQVKSLLMWLCNGAQVVCAGSRRDVILERGTVSGEEGVGNVEISEAGIEGLETICEGGFGCIGGWSRRHNELCVVL